MINTNNYSQNRGSEVINSMTDYTYSDTFYNAIVQEELQEQFNFQDQQYGSVNCYHSPLYYNNPLYFDPLSYEVE